MRNLYFAPAYSMRSLVLASRMVCHCMLPGASAPPRFGATSPGIPALAQRSAEVCPVYSYTGLLRVGRLSLVKCKRPPKHHDRN
jgi:hypothetical protein